MIDTMNQLFQFCFTVLNYTWHWGQYTFTLWQVLTGALFLSFIGSVAGHIIFIKRGE